MSSKFADTDNGNISIDFLMGLLVFVLAFAYIMTAIPGIFVPYQSTSIDLGSVVYRTSSILVEDPGWYRDTSLGVSYSDWDQGDNQKNVTRVGLAIDKRSPNVLSMDKIRAMQGLSYTTARDKMGMNNTVMYNFSLSLKALKPTGPVEILNFSSEGRSGIMESIDRIVHIREGQGILINDPSIYLDPLNDTLFGPQNYGVINHNPGLYGNVSVRIQGLNIPADTPYPVTVAFYYDDAHDMADWGHFNQTADYLNNEYYIYRNGIYVDDIEIVDYNTTDVLDIIIDTNRIYNKYFLSSMNLSTVRVNTASTSSCFPREWCLFYDQSNPLYQYYDTEGIMTLRVWQI
jgi:hypothetical protein